jgi:hypothetical protein
MTDVTKLIAELESKAGPFKDDLYFRAAAALRALATQTPDDGIGKGEIPYKIIVELYNATIRGTHLPPAKGLTPMRKRMVAQRWTEDKERQTIEWWATFFKRIVASDFLAGRSAPSAGHENWRPNFDWFIKPGNLLKVIEGSYDNKGPRSNAENIARFR